MLDLYLRKYAWTAKLALLFAAAWLAAKIVNTAVGAVIRPTPRIDLSALPASAPRAQMWSQLEVDRLYPLIGQRPPAPTPTDDAGPTPPPPPRTCGDRMAPPRKTGLRAQLVAGVIAEEPRWSIASITDLTAGDTRGSRPRLVPPMSASRSPRRPRTAARRSPATQRAARPPRPPVPPPARRARSP